MIDERHRYMLVDRSCVEAHAAARREAAEVYRDRLSQIKQLTSDRELLSQLAQYAEMVAYEAAVVLEAADYTEHPDTAVKMFSMALRNLSNSTTSLLVVMDLLNDWKMEGSRQERAQRWAQLLVCKHRLQ